jgi:2-hydroxy-3-oxopropionate reductase
MVGATDGGFRRVRPWLRLFASVVVHVGPVGAGTTAKLIHNMVGEIQVQAFAEALAFSSVLGLDGNRLFDCLAAGMAGSRILTDLYGDGILVGNRDVHVSVDTASKDQRLLLQLARSAGVTLRWSPQVLSFLQDLQARGAGGQDISMTLESFERIHNTRVRIDNAQLEESRGRYGR